jgi:hypothetical protein
MVTRYANSKTSFELLLFSILKAVLRTVAKHDASFQAIATRSMATVKLTKNICVFFIGIF